MPREMPHSRSALRWTLIAFVLALPFLLILCIDLWRMPFPLSEAVALLEDVANRRVSTFFVPTTSYYRPLYYAALSAAWHGAGSIPLALRWIKLLHIIPVSALVLLFVWQLRPRTLPDTAAASVAIAVLAGAPGLLGNLELPLSYTVVGMPLALAVWMLAEREPRRWASAAIVLATIVAIGFKEQGLVIVPVVVAARWMRAPGVTRATAATVAGLAIVYVAFRLVTHPAGAPMFEQDIGYGFEVMSPRDAAARFGASPMWIFAYNSAATVGNLLFAEPTGGVFRIVKAIRDGQTQPWQWVDLCSSAALTVLVGWWGCISLRQAQREGWSADSRLFVGAVLAVLACGALSFDYSRDRLGGMAVPFYALAAYAAVRLAVLRASVSSTFAAALVAVALLAVSACWQLRAIHTLEFTRQRAVNAQREWLTDIGPRRIEFAGRPTYIRIMEAMSGQGTSGDVEPMRYPRWFVRMIGEE